MTISPCIVPTTKLRNYDVVNLKGEDMGQVQTFMVDLMTGKIPFVIVSFGGILGITDKWLAIPWELLGWQTNEQRFVLSIPREKLKEAPGFDKEKWPDEIDIKWLKDIYTYYSSTP